MRELPEVETTLVTIGADPQNTLNLGSIFVKLEAGRGAQEEPVRGHGRDPAADPAAVRALRLRAQVQPVAAFGAGNNAEIQFWIGGPDLEQLEKYAAVLMQKLKAIPGAVDVDTNLVVGKPELGVRIDRAKAGDLGVRVQDVASTLNVLVGGHKVTDYYEGGEQYEVHVRADA